MWDTDRQPICPYQQHDKIHDEAKEGKRWPASVYKAADGVSIEGEIKQKLLTLNQA